MSENLKMLIADDETARNAIRSELDTNMLVEAGAGSGKTTLMVERLLQYVARGTPVDELAAVTFTKKAANELRQRFESRMEVAARSEDPMVQERIAVALRNRERMFIGTVHAFCGRILREHALDAGLPPDFTELDQTESHVLRDSMWREFIEESSRLGSVSIARVLDTGLDPLTLSGAFKQREQYRDVAFEARDVPPPDHAGMRGLLVDFLQEALVVRVNTTSEPDSLTETLDRIRRARVVHDDWTSVVDFAHDVAPLLVKSNRKLTQNRWGITKEQKANASAFSESIDAFVEQQLTPWMEKWWAHVYAPVIRLLNEGSSWALARRRRAGQLGFDDLLTETARLLRINDDARRSVGEHYRHLLVDEFQDTDPVQAEVCFLIASSPEQGNDWSKVELRDGALFVVGDPKQSIYRFRRADLAVYRMVEGRLAACGKVVHLTRNFRSVAAIGAVVNEHFATQFVAPGDNSARSTFQAPFAPLIATERTYPNHGAHQKSGAYRYQVGPTAFVYPAAIHDEDSARLATWIAERCAPDGDRNPEDFLILTRGKPELSRYARELALRNIPVVVTGASNSADDFLGELLVVLRALSDPQNPIAIIAALEGWCMGCSHQDLWNAQLGGIEFRITHAPNEQQSPVGAGLEQLYQWWIASQRVSSASLLERVMNESGLFFIAASSELGDRSAGQLLQLEAALRNSARTGLRAAIELIEEMFESDEDDAPTMRNVRGGAVRLMNLHKSKGLEAKVVVLAAPSKKQEWPATLATWRAVDGSAKGALRVLDDGDHAVAQPANWNVVAAAEAEREEAERVRLLYVAATRAEEELVVAQRTPYATSKGEPRVDEGAWAPLGEVLAIHAQQLELVRKEPPGRRLAEVSAATLQREIVQASKRLQNATKSRYTLVSVTEAVKRDAATAEADGASLAQELGESEDSRPASANVAARSARRAPIDVREFGTLAHAAVEGALRGRNDEQLLHYVNALAWHQLPDQTAENRKLIVSRVMQAVADVKASSSWSVVKEYGLPELSMASVSGDLDAGTGVLSEGILDVAALRENRWTIVDWKFSGSTDAQWKTQLLSYQAQTEAYVSTLHSRTGTRGVAHIERIRINR